MKKSLLISSMMLTTLAESAFTENLCCSICGELEESNCGCHNETDRGIHIISACNEGRSLRREDIELAREAFEEMALLIIEDEKPKNHLKNVIDEMVSAIEIHRAMQPNDSDIFINNKMKWKKPRWQR